MNRSRVKVFSALCAVVALAATLVPAGAQSAIPSFWFAGTRLIFARAVPLDDDVAVSVSDPGLKRFLARLGATVSFTPQERYVIFTAADRRTITFTLGSTAYTAGGIASRAAFAPYLDGDQAIVPLYAVAHALYVEPVPGAGEMILQPQIGGLDVHTDARRTTIVIRGATQLAFVKRVETPEHVELAFGGIASTLTGERRIGASTTVSIVSGGSPKNPSTVITFDAPPGAQHAFLLPATPYEVALAFTGIGAPATATAAPPVDTSAAAGAANAPPPPPMIASATPFPAPAAAASAAGSPDGSAPVPAPSVAGPAVVTGVMLTPVDGGLSIHVTVNGSATYDWHRLADLRWYVDIHNATLTDAGRDERPAIPAVDSVRIRQIGTADAPVVRIALTMRGEKRIDVVPQADGLTIGATNIDTVAAARTGGGRIGSAAVDQSVAIAPSTAPSPARSSDVVPTPPAVWKFAPPVNGSRIIVLDPGHGGDDVGTAHNGLVEKTITIDIARRLRTLLVAQGWSVRMTRDSDIDPVTPANLALMAADGKPNPSDRAYLQTRCDVANNVNARLFISIHVNYSDSSAVNGTTFYWYKPQDQALATTLERAVIPVAGTTDIGPRHENFYVIHHTTMPAVLIETAFISNPHDAALLRTPEFLQNMAQGIANGVRAYAAATPVQASQADP